MFATYNDALLTTDQIAPDLEAHSFSIEWRGNTQWMIKRKERIIGVSYSFGQFSLSALSV